MKTIGIGLIGAGFAARERHLTGLRTVPNASVRIVCARDSNNARRIAGEFGIPHVTGHWKEVIESPQVDAVIIATPPGMHAEITVAALEAGKHVLCQGRMARNLTEARRMAAAALKSDRITALYPPKPGLKGDRVVQRLLNDGQAIGEVHEIRVASMAMDATRPGYDWRTDPDVVGVNVMALGMWAEVLHRWVGRAKVVAALSATRLGSRITAEGKTATSVIPNSLSISASMECGAQASFHFSNVCPVGVGHSIEIFGTNGALRYELFKENLWVSSNGEKTLQSVEISPEEERQQSTDREFIEAIRDGAAVSPDFEDGLAYMTFCESVAASCFTGKKVGLADVQPFMDSWERPL